LLTLCCFGIALIYLTAGLAIAVVKMKKQKN
jgi:hypothetical protein